MSLLYFINVNWIALAIHWQNYNKLIYIPNNQKKKMNKKATLHHNFVELTLISPVGATENSFK